MAVVIDGTAGISTPAEAVAGNLSYTGTLTGGAGVINLGSGQVYKDTSGNVGIGTSSPWSQISSYGVSGATTQYIGFKNADGGDIRFGKASGVDNGCILGTWSGNGMLFYTNSTERARIDSSGNLLVGTTSNPSAYKQVLAWDGAVISGLDFRDAQAAAGSAFAAAFRRAGTAVGTISTTLSATSFNTASDYRLKEAIAPMTGALAKIALLKPCTYKWKVDGSDGQGFIAHELAEVEAGCVTGEKDAVDADGNPQYQGIDTSFLIATLTAAIQEQQTTIVSLQDTLTALTTRITALEGTAA